MIKFIKHRLFKFHLIINAVRWCSLNIFKLKKKYHQFMFKRINIPFNEFDMLKLSMNITNTFKFIKWKRNNITSPISSYSVWSFYIDSDCILIKININNMVSIYWVDSNIQLLMYDRGDLMTNIKTLLYDDIYPMTPYEALEKYVFDIIIREYI